jgi:hypothetical protein
MNFQFNQLQQKFIALGKAAAETGKVKRKIVTTIIGLYSVISGSMVSIMV